MALDKAIDSAQLDADLTAVADAIREKGGTTDALSFPNGFVEAVGAIQADGGSTEDVLDSYLNGTMNGNYVNETLTSVRSDAFAGSRFTSVRLKNVTEAGKSEKDNGGGFVFRTCDKLETVVFDKRISFYGYQQYNSSFALKRIVYKNGVDSWGMHHFYTSTNIEALVLGGAFTPIDSDHYLSSTAIGKGNGYIYVPSSLIEEYKTATNWSVYADQFRAIDDYPGIDEV